MDAPVLVTGATGYIGGRLLRHFEAGGRRVRCLARNPERVRVTRSTTEVFQGDCFDEQSLDPALNGVDSAYYFVDPTPCVWRPALEESDMTPTERMTRRVAMRTVKAAAVHNSPVL